LKKLRKFITIIFTAVLTLTMAACAAKPAFDFDQDAAVKRAKDIVDILNTQDYDAFFNQFSDDVKKLTTAEGLKASLKPILDAAGAFKEYKSTEALGLLAKDGTKIIDIYVKTVYEKAAHVYEVSFDTDLNLIGFHTVS
jgi:hypothetical protein